MESTVSTKLGAGLTGVAALTLAHEAVRALVPDAPRADLAAMKAIDRFCEMFDLPRPRADQRRTIALGADFLFNGLAYAWVGRGRARHPWMRGSLLGALMGVAAVEGPPLLGMSRRPTARSDERAGMTVGLYLLGGLAAAAATWILRKRHHRRVLSKARARAAEVRDRALGEATVDWA
jgi:hypothetical protein